ncbi:unnamed protein product [Rhizoctonia solani]|uniref:Sm domain-containing protein n=1 Tax=Rhizoctonia solani TaxID=456999 RepID=A0A8H2XPC8_9AGAM|nr:unnamed protein product [Rhizoctonia solani]
MDATKHMSDKVQELNSLLAKTLRVSIQDGRSFIGTFACIDREKNIVLSSTDEYPPPHSQDGPRTRTNIPEIMTCSSPWLALALVPTFEVHPVELKGSPTMTSQTLLIAPLLCSRLTDMEMRN